MRVPKKEGISRGREKKIVGRFVITRCLCNANLGAATRISGTRGEFRARGANLGHFRCSSDRQIRIVYIFLGTSRPARRISGHISESSAGSESGTRLTGGVGRFLAHL